MKEFTYENQNNNKRYETYEWDNTWIEHANNTDAKRVLYIGDSISCGIRRIATELTNEKILFDGFGTSKGIDNPYLMDSIKIFAAQQGKRDVILFNNDLPVIDLYAESKTNQKYLKNDGVHFLKKGYVKLAKKIVAEVKNSIN